VTVTVAGVVGVGVLGIVFVKALVDVLVAVSVAVGVIVSVGVAIGEFVAEGIGVSDGVLLANVSTEASRAFTPGKCAPTGKTLGSTAKGRLPNVPSNTGIMAGSMGPKSVMGVGTNTLVTRILAVTTPENPTFSTACCPTMSNKTITPPRSAIATMTR
jgi:hypothetical protein